MKNKTNGISLILLIITIIVVIIIAGAVVVNLSKNNPINQASEAKFKSDVGEYNSDLLLTLSQKKIDDNSFDPTTVNASAWNGSGSTDGTVKEYIPSMSDEDAKNFIIQNGKLVYIGENDSERGWLSDVAANAKLLFTENFQTNTYKCVNTTANWTKGTLGSSNNEVLTKVTHVGSAGYDYYNNVIQDGDGNYIAVGSYNDDFIITKFDINLNKINQKVFGSTGSDCLEDIIVDGDGNYVAFGDSNGNLTSLGGTTNNGSWDFVVIKFDKQFNILKLSHIGKDQQDSFIHCIVDNDGNYVGCGISESNWSTTGGNTNKGDWDAAIVKYDKDLNFLGIQTIGGTNWERFWNISQDPSGDYVVVGDSTSDLSAYSSYGASANKGYTDGTVAKFDKNLNLLKMITLGGTDDEFLFALTIDKSGNYVVGGSSASDLSAYGGYVPNDALDYLVFKLDSNLNLLKLKTFGADNANYVMSLCTDSANNYVFGGQTFSTDSNAFTSGLKPSGEGSVVFGKLDSNLNCLYLNKYGSMGDVDSIYDVIQSSNGNYIAAGFNQYSKTDIGSAATNGSVDCSIFEFGFGEYDSTKNIIESNAITLDTPTDKIGINVSASNTTNNNYIFYISTNGSDWVNVPNSQLNGQTNINLGSQTNKVYFKVKLIGYGSYTPQIYAVELYSYDSSKPTAKIYTSESTTFQYETADTQLSSTQNDDTMFTVPLSFNLTLGDKTYNKLYVSTNGAISPDNNDISYDNQSLYTVPMQLISVYWTDLIVDKNVNANSGVYYKIGTDGGKNYVLIEYRDIFVYGHKTAGYEGNFEVKIYEDGTIKMMYKNVDFYSATSCNGANATVGVNINDKGISQYLYNTKKLSQNVGLLFSLK